MNSSQQQLQKLKNIKDQNFVQECIGLYNKPSLVEENKGEISFKTNESYAYSTISLVFAIFGLYVLSFNGDNIKSIILFGLLIGLLSFFEWLKRYQITNVAKNYLNKKSYQFGILILIIPTVISVSISGFGGFKLSPELRGSPTLVKNEQIDSLKNQLNVLQSSIAKQEGTTWKGRVTRTANKNLTNLYSDKSSLSSRIKELEDADSAENSKIKAEFNDHSNLLGYLLGFIGFLVDILLYTCLFKVMTLKHQISLLYANENLYNIDINNDGHIGDPEKPTPTPPGGKKYTIEEWKSINQALSDDKNIIHLNKNHRNEVATSSYDSDVEIQYIIGALKDANSNLTAWMAKPDTCETKEENIQKYTDVINKAKADLKSKGVDPNTVLKKRKSRA